MAMTVAVAMSGGVDSSLVALTMKKRGCRVIGLTMLLTDESRGVDNAGSEVKSGSAAEDARLVADFLGIEHHVVDLRRQFYNEVIDYFLGEYMRGRTPNPCVVCNPKIKFGALWEEARRLGADAIATGHYARVVMDEGRGQKVIKKGIDSKKDQSYALNRLPKELLPCLVLPLGEMTKDKVRSIAESEGLPVAHRPESQEVCFIPDDDYKGFLLKHYPDAKRQGDIVDGDGNVLGHHDGVAFYTIGQRKGMGIAHPTPLYVNCLDAEHNRVIVGENSEVFSNGLIASDVNWQAVNPPMSGEVLRASIKVRYGKRETAAGIEPIEGSNGKYRVMFDAPIRAVAPGQSVVLYDGDTLLGGGFIDEAIR